MKNIYFCSRTSHEVRGLKYEFFCDFHCPTPSHLTRGAWIEIISFTAFSWSDTSHLTRGAWIEILLVAVALVLVLVAPHTRCVD